MIEIEVSDKCTLLQACEWIAFKWEPMDDIYEQYEGRIRPKHPMLNINLGLTPKPSIEWENYLAELAKGTAALKIALLKKQINAIGRPLPKKGTPLGGAPFHLERNIIDFKTFFFLDTKDNKITSGTETVFYDILIDFNELRLVFPGITKKNTNTYKSEYMLLMEEVITQENITDKNQSKQDVLKDIIEQKMSEKGLPKSAKLASAMATLIRQPWAQIGRKKKG